MGKLEYLTGNEAKALLNAASETRDKAILTLFLETGIFFNELSDLNISSINWKKKLLRVGGRRKREIPLNDETYNILVDWSKARADCKTAALFITRKGEVNRVSPRNIDRLIRKYADDAGLAKNVNAKVLRNTFAVNFLRKETDIARAASILGMTSLRGMNKYVKAAKAGTTTTGDELEHLDTRPQILRRISKIFTKQPKEGRILKPAAQTKEAEVTIGREAVITDINNNLHKGLSMVLHSPLGLGKTHLLKHIAKEKGYLYLSSPTPIKEAIAEICQKYCPDWEKKLSKRASVKQMVENLLNALDASKPRSLDALVIDNLDRLKKSDLDIFTALLDKFTILGAAEELPERLKPVWWKLKKLELEPLSDTASHALITQLTQDFTVENRKLLETQIASHADGDPLAIVEMINQLRGLPRVREADIRDLHHEAGVKYIEVKNLVIVLWLAAIAYRFIALGTHSFENYILAGFFVTFAVGLRMFLRKT